MINEREIIMGTAEIQAKVKQVISNVLKMSEDEMKQILSLIWAQIQCKV